MDGSVAGSRLQAEGESLISQRPGDRVRWGAGRSQ